MDLNSVTDRILDILKKDKSDLIAVNDLFEVCRLIENDDFQKAHNLNKIVRQTTAGQLKANLNISKLENYYYLRKKSLLFDAKLEFNAYLQYLEYDREPEKRFYLPRLKIIKPIVDALQEIEDDKLDILAISQPPGTGKSTLGIFFLSWQMGKYPNMPNLASAHSDKLTRSFYDGVNSVIKDPEYLWHDVFPSVNVAGVNSKDETIDLDKPKRFKTLTCRSIDGSLTGATRCERILYADDLVSGIEEALSIDRMDNLWSKYTNDLKSRKKLGCKEIHIATRWSVHDPIGRLENLYENEPRAKFLAFPALDENDESNFDYDYGVGFNTKYFIDMRESLDEVSWRCIFQNEPVEREGLLFPEDGFRYYNGVLPDGEPDRIIAAADIAWGGGDSLSMPFGYIYGEECYIPDVIFNNGDKEVTRPIVCGKLKLHLPHQTQMEANNGGHEYCDNVDNKLRCEGIYLNISHRKAPNNASKLSRIIQAAPDIKKFIFLDKNHQSGEYRKFMKELTSFMQTGKNKHDDAPDSLAMLSNLMHSQYGNIEVVSRLF